MTIYLGILLYYISVLILGRAIKVKLNKKLITIFMLLPLFVLVAFRAPIVGNDTYSYFQTYNTVIQESFLSNSSSRLEIGYILSARVFGILGLDYIVFQIATTLFIYYSLGRFISKFSSNIVISLITFITLNMFFQTMNISRQYIAIAILLFSVDFILEKKIFKFTLLVAFASLFHASAIVFFILYPLSTVNLNNLQKIQLFVVVIFLSLIFERFVSWFTGVIGRYENHLGGQYFQIEGNIAIYVNLLIYSSFWALASYINYRQKKDRNNYEENRVNISSNFVSIEKVCYTAVFTIFLFGILGLRTALIPRLISYFLPFYMLFVPNLIKYIKNNVSKIMVLYIVSLSMVMYFTIVMVYRPEWTGVIPYVFYWEIN